MKLNRCKFICILLYVVLVVLLMFLLWARSAFVAAGDKCVIFLYMFDGCILECFYFIGMEIDF